MELFKKTYLSEQVKNYCIFGNFYKQSLND